MVLHIGSDEFIPLSCIVAVLDAAACPELLAELSQPSRDGFLVQRVGAERVKSILAARRAGAVLYYLSPISAQTLRKRVESGSA